LRRGGEGGQVERVEEEAPQLEGEGGQLAHLVEGAVCPSRTTVGTSEPVEELVGVLAVEGDEVSELRAVVVLDGVVELGAVAAEVEHAGLGSVASSLRC